MRWNVPLLLLILECLAACSKARPINSAAEPQPSAVEPSAATSPPADEPNSAPMVSIERVIDQDHSLLRVARLSGRGPDFAPNVTKALWDELPSNVKRCSQQLLDAQLRAHAANRSLADRTFRNCSIEESAGWIREQLELFRSAMDRGRREDATEALGEAIAALHSFYAYTNYVELLDKKNTDWDAVSDHPHEIWKEPSGDLGSTSGLVSDYNPGALPNRCSNPLPQLDKSTSSTPQGKQVLRSLGIGAHAAAVDLALSDTTALLRSALADEPEYGEDCGSSSVFGWILGW